MRSERSAPSIPNGATRTGRQHPAQRRVKAVYVAIFAVLALTAAQCARLGMAGLLVQTAQFEAGQLTATAKKPSIEEITRAADYFTQSFAYAADNPWALENAGALDLAKMRATTSPRQAYAAARDARARFRRALAQRPTSPFLWANLALAKLYLDEIDSELLAALRHAGELGPWDRSVQEKVLFVGLAVWPELDAGMRQELARTIERGGSRNAQKMFEIAKSYARFDLVCAIEQYRVVAGPDCAKIANAVKPGAPTDRGSRQ
jgi:hypothetical protein